VPAERVQYEFVRKENLLKRDAMVLSGYRSARRRSALRNRVDVSRNARSDFALTRGLESCE